MLHIYIGKKIEVAFSISTFSDMAGIDEEKGKGLTPKEIVSCEWFLGHTVKNDMTVTRELVGRYPENTA